MFEGWEKLACQEWAGKQQGKNMQTFQYRAMKNKDCDIQLIGTIISHTQLRRKYLYDKNKKGITKEAVKLKDTKDSKKENHIKRLVVYFMLKGPQGQENNYSIYTNSYKRGSRTGRLQ